MRLAPALLAAAVLTGCTAGGGDASAPAPEVTTQVATATLPRVETDLDLARSEPVEDSVYPHVGDPGVDALHYDLTLDWQPERRRQLVATADVTFRATEDADSFQLDLAARLGIRSVLLDGRDAAYSHDGKDLVVAEPVAADEQYELEVQYGGRPRPIRAPTTRRDFWGLGWTVEPSGETWTMQEPYGAYSWYPVNDQPSDKALYDFTITAPRPWTGVANGRLVERSVEDGRQLTRWQLDEPASSYLVTVAIGDYAHSSNTTEDGLVVDYWYPRGVPGARQDLSVAASGVDWIEDRLGPYPFSSLGIVMTDSMSGMETQTMITLGNNPYVRSAPVIVHELVHQWIGDQVSPADWRDVWLNEGMTMLMQALWEDEHGERTLEEMFGEWEARDQELRDTYGPPGDWDPVQFGGSNIYYLPALMWNELRLELSDQEFFRITRDWLSEHDNQSVTREQLYDFWEAETGRELTAFFDAWIMGETTPTVEVP
ncbi:hypothetical protein DDE18_01160 [Nocardioides gansuensis]|uniref:Aminopeptidase N n=1 Tax=Nocardioides gansuensis TaxID=2138300 RepID=A0A2T8FEX0_9ACTN|nr:M1 family metallopeptidase [Nocardioides gansuensis]PVG84272.1 hypothetical protein DDE18_01160 [Nocardioides gansuensis]